MKKLFPVYLIVVLSLVLSACGAATSITTPTPRPPVKANSSTLEVKGKVVPVTSAILRFPALGTIEAVLAEEGKSIKAGEVIARLEGAEQAKAVVAAAELELVSARQALTTLEENAKVATAETQMALAKARVELDDAKEDRKKLDWSRGTQSTVEEFEAEVLLAKKALDNAQMYYDYVDPDKKGDSPERANALLILSQARKRYERALANKNYAQSVPKKEEIAEADARLAKAEAQVAFLEGEYQRLKSGPDPRKVELAQARLKNAESQLEAARKRHDDLELTAPFDCVVISNTLKVGEVTSTATSVTVADLSAWQVETTDLKEGELSKVSVGQTVRLKFEAIPDLELAGEVERIRIQGQKPYGDVLFTVIIQLYKQDPRLLWNMTADISFGGENAPAKQSITPAGRARAAASQPTPVVSPTKAPAAATPTATLPAPPDDFSKAKLVNMFHMADWNFAFIFALPQPVKGTYYAEVGSPSRTYVCAPNTAYQHPEQLLCQGKLNGMNRMVKYEIYDKSTGKLVFSGEVFIPLKN
ncbi:MAG TPA: HlyD family efflux transporter periplasmic adaptor subunit [Anaerolineaceae bacterium]